MGLTVDVADPGYVLVLRTCKADMTSHNGFRWPDSGPVEAPDWDPAPRCGNGLHGMPWGEGEAVLLDWSPDARWLVVRVSVGTLVDLGGKVKYPAGEVVYCGDRAGATGMIHATRPGAILGLIATGGDDSNLTGGHRSNLTGGDGSNLTGGDGSNLTGGHRSNLTGGYRSNLTGGDGSNLTGGYGSNLTGGHRSTLIFYWWDSRADRRRVTTAYPGEDGIEPGKPYRCKAGSIVPAEEG